MSYTKKQFVQELKQQLQYGYDIQEVANWAYLLRIDRYREIDDSELDDIIYTIHMMEAGPEFELSEEEILDLINKLEASE